MARTKPDVEWFYNPSIWYADYGILCLAGKWAVVRAKTFRDDDGFDVVTDWLDSREAAFGFLKLLKD